MIMFRAAAADDAVWFVFAKPRRAMTPALPRAANGNLDNAYRYLSEGVRRPYHFKRTAWN